MNIHLSLPSGVHEGENLPLSASFPASGMRAPRLMCGFDACDCAFELRSVGDDWQGVANVRSGLAGQAFLKFRLTDPCRPGREWRGEVNVRFAARQQSAPIHVTGVNSQAEKSGMGQANSVNITVNGLGAGGGTAQVESLWQSVEVLLHECDAPVSIPPNPLPSPSSPVNPLASMAAPPSSPDTEPAKSTGIHSEPHRESAKDTVFRGHSMVLAATLLILIAVVSFLAIKNRESPPPPVPQEGAGSAAKTEHSTKSAQPETPSDKPAVHPPSQGPSALPVVPTPPQQPREEASNTQLSMIELAGVKPVYRAGEFLTFQVKLAQPGYLRVMADVLDPARETVSPTWLYPSKRDQEKLFSAGSWHEIPDTDTVRSFSGERKYGFPCLLTQGKAKETTKVVIQYSPEPFSKDGTTLADDGVFYQYDTPATWQVAKKRGIGTSAGTPTTEAREITFEVMSP